MHPFRVLILLLATSSFAFAEDWPGWLGPRRDSSSREKVAVWKEPLKVLWKQPIGEAHSSPIVAEGLVIVHTKAKDSNEEIIATYNALDGKPGWSFRYDRGDAKYKF